MIAKKVLLSASIVIAVLVVNCQQLTTSPNVSPEKANSAEQPKPSAPSSVGLNQSIRITTPTDNEQVVERPIVEGTVSDPKATVWVIVHPMDVATYWVQPSVTLREGGRWRVQIYIGRPGAADLGKHFEIMAVANPRNRLKDGDQLIGWPEAQWKSQVIEVLRK